MGSYEGHYVASFFKPLSTRETALYPLYRLQPWRTEGVKAVTSATRGLDGDVFRV